MFDMITLGDVLSTPIRNGLTKPSAIRGSGVKMIGMGELFAYGRIGDIPMDLVPVTEKELDTASIQVGDLLFARQSLVLEGAGQCSIVTEVNEPTVFESHLIRLRVDTQKILPQFVYYYFNSYYGRESIKTIVEQVAAAGIRGKDLIKLKVPCPSLHEQKQVVDAIEILDKKIEINKEICVNLDEQIKAVFKEMFVDGAECREWDQNNLESLVSSTLGGDWGKESEMGNYTQRVYCIRGADIPEVSMGNKGKMPTRFILPKNYVNKRLVDGDLVVEISGGSPTQSTGRIAAITQALLDRYDQGMVCTNFCRAIKPIPSYSMFLYYYWQYLYERDVFFSYENGTTGIKNLDLSGVLQNEVLSIPPKDTVERFNSFCHRAFARVQSTGLQNENLEELKAVLINELYKAST